MEAVMRRRAERLSSSDSETDCLSHSSSSSVGSSQIFDSSESEDSNDATMYYSPSAVPSTYVPPPQPVVKNVKGNSRRNGLKSSDPRPLVSPRELEALLTPSTELKSVGTQTSPGVRVTRSLSRQASPELF